MALGRKGIRPLTKPKLPIKPRSWLSGLLWHPDIPSLHSYKHIADLMRVLEHPKPKVRWSAMQALGQLWNIPSLVDLGSSELEIRREAAEQLGLLNDERVVVPLVASLWDPAILYYIEVHYFFPVRISAARGLGVIGNPLAVEPIVKALRSYPWGYPPTGDDEIYLSLLNIGEPMVVRLITLLQDNEEHVREHAIRMLGHSDDPQVIEPLGELLISEKNRLLKLAIMQSLFKIGHESLVIPTLNLALQQERDMGTRLDLLSYLSKMSDRKVIPIIKDALGKADIGTQKIVIRNIIKFGTPEALEAIEGLREHRSS